MLQSMGLHRVRHDSATEQQIIEWTLKVFLVAQVVKNLPAPQETQVQSLGQEDPLEKGMGVHSSILA